MILSFSLSDFVRSGSEINARMPWLTQRLFFFYSILVLVFKDCQGLFLRHTDSGKCITGSDELVYDNPNHALPYFVVMTDNCLDDKAQFLYLNNTELLHNIEKEGTLMSEKGNTYKSRWAVYKGISERALKSQKNTRFHLKQTAGGSLAQDKICAKPETKYVKRSSDCDLANQQFTFGSVINYGAKMVNVGCSSRQYMKIKSANYGDFSKNGVFHDDQNVATICSAVTTCRMKSRCNGNRFCELTIDNSLLPSQHCSDNSKEIYTKYTCGDTNSLSPITEVPKIRLEYRNAGSIEIKDGSTWKRVDEENWDRNHQKALCEHLGFEEEIDIRYKDVNSGEMIATGDLICYNTSQSGGRSCCAYLQRTTTSSGTSIPYARCKLCDKPLLRDENIFPPTSVYSGSGDPNNGYANARINGSGWCASGSGTYLSLDLGKEYHITKVAIMGDKEQTKWSQSYSFKYSHDNTYKNSRQINGSQNGYQASITHLNIYNVRYIKIQSDHNDHFCLRVELCGEVQAPAPVEAFVTKPSNFSVYLSWTIPSSNESSYITHFVIYLNGKLHKNISREVYGNQFTIHGLKPITKYNVSIETRDGNYEKGGRKSTQFKTDEAVPSGPPEGVSFQSRSNDSLTISWKVLPKSLRNGNLTGYQVCFYVHNTTGREKCQTTTFENFTMNGLKPSTKYFVTVAAGTKVGYGNKSSKIYKITNGDSVTPVATSYSSLRLNITELAEYINGVMVVIRIGKSSEKPTENIETSELKPYIKNKQDPYITAYFQLDKKKSLAFVIGGGSMYRFESKNTSYVNHPLEQNSSYIVFLRFFENANSFYSTQWSSGVKTMVKPPAPKISIISAGLSNYNISWSLTSLPKMQSVLLYYTTYILPNKARIQRNVSYEISFFNFTVDIEEQYTFKVQVETQAGKSDETSETWWSHSVPLEVPEETDAGYKVKLRKPKAEQNIEKVALILLQSESTDPPPPENLEIQDSPPLQSAEENTDVAFIAKTFEMDNFKNDELEILLRESKSRRKKRATDVDVPLRNNATYRFTQRNEDKTGKFSWSYWSEPFNYIPVIISPPATTLMATRAPVGGDGSGNSTAAAVGATIAVVAIVIALVLGIIYFKRRRAMQDSSGKKTVYNDDNFDEMEGIDNGGNEGQDGVKIAAPPANEDIYSNQTGFVEENKHPPVPVAEFAHYVNELKENYNYAFQSQYDDLPTSMNTSWEVSKRSFNKQKNRYGNIVTYDYCRVVLSGDEREDYINASHIDGIEQNSYIASQGPTKVTVDDMWKMVWEQRCYSIVMVTALVEVGKPKCEKYWPDKESKMYGDIEVTLMKTEAFAYYVTHVLQIKKNGEEREVRHYYFQSWPDHGVPKYPTQLLAFRRHFRTHHLEQSGPVLIHCSAGVGRTGVFLAIDAILLKLEKGVINSIDVFGQVNAMRERRMHMVQTLEQYIFIHEAILETILCGMNEVDSSRIKNEVKTLSQVKASGMTGFQERFKRLGEVTPKLSEDDCVAGLLEGNINKNRNKNVCPSESNRVPLTYLSGVENSDYINAVFVHGYLGRNYFIATQSPLPNTIDDFWRLVNSQKSSTIVLLNNVKDGTSFPRFWPTERGEPIQYDTLTVQLDSETESDGIWTRKFILSPYPDLTDGQVVNIFHYTKWGDHRVPQNGNGVITLMSLVEKSRQSHGQGPVIVACSDGAGRTGTYIAISNLLERMKIEQAMDVFQAIKIIRGIRPQFVENAEQYQFCYTAVMAYLDAFSEYANFE